MMWLSQGLGSEWYSPAFPDHLTSFSCSAQAHQFKLYHKQQPQLPFVTLSFPTSMMALERAEMLSGLDALAEVASGSRPGQLQSTHPHSSRTNNSGRTSNDSMRYRLIRAQVFNIRRLVLITLPSMHETCEALAVSATQLPRSLL